MNQQPLWPEQQQPYYQRKMPYRYNWYILGALIVLYLSSCVLFSIASGQPGTTDPSKEPLIYQDMSSAGTIAVLIFYGIVIALDARNFFTLNGKIRWSSLNILARLGLGFAYCGIWLIPPIYLVMAIQYRWQTRHPGQTSVPRIVNSSIIYPQTSSTRPIPPPPPPPISYGGIYPQPAIPNPQPHYQPYPAPLPLRRNTVFLSYNRKDIHHLQRLQTHFMHYEHMGIVETWSDTKIAQGDLWQNEISKALARTRVAVLLVSADYLASRFIIEQEIPPLLHAARTEGTIILPIILSACAFDTSPLAQFQAVNNPKKPVSGMNRDETEKLWATTAKIVSNAVNSRQTSLEVLQTLTRTLKES